MTTALSMNLPVGSIEAYLNHVNQVPVLTELEEKELAERFYHHGDVEAARQLVYSHLRFVVKIARGYMGYGLALNDLIQEGSIGLMKAVRRFNPDVGVRLVTFAVHWIKAEMHDFILKNWRIVKIATTKAQRKLFFNLRAGKKGLTWLSKQEAEDIATDLKVTTKDVYQMEQRLYSHDDSFDAHPLDVDNDQAFAPEHYLEDQSANPELIVTNSNSSSLNAEALHQAIEKLDERSQEILQARWLSDNKATLQELAAKYNVSAERVRQLENNAMKKIKAEMSALMAA